MLPYGAVYLWMSDHLAAAGPPTTCLSLASLTVSCADFVLSFAKRGELLTHLTRVGTFDLTVTRFYTAELVHAVEHLHRVGVIHR